MVRIDHKILEARLSKINDTSKYLFVGRFLIAVGGPIIMKKSTTKLKGISGIFKRSDRQTRRFSLAKRRHNLLISNKFPAVSISKAASIAEKDGSGRSHLVR
nr:unnamed protein product [Callosobruchus chinensis]